MATRYGKYDPRKRVIDGEVWELSGHKIATSKVDAKKNQKELRSWGLNARVVSSVRGKGYWCVYTRKRTKERKK